MTTTAQTQQPQALTMRMWKREQSDRADGIPAKEITPGVLGSPYTSVREAIANADYVTIPIRLENRRTGELTQDGISEERAYAVAEKLKEAFGYDITLNTSKTPFRTSLSGNSFVFERHSLVSGVDVTDVLGL